MEFSEYATKFFSFCLFDIGVDSVEFQFPEIIVLVDVLGIAQILLTIYMLYLVSFLMSNTVCLSSRIFAKALWSFIEKFSRQASEKRGFEKYFT